MGGGGGGGGGPGDETITNGVRICRIEYYRYKVTHFMCELVQSVFPPSTKRKGGGGHTNFP